MINTYLQLKWTDPDEAGLMEFLVNEKGFSEERVKSGLDKLKKARGTSVQNRLTSYFGAPITVVSTNNKRKVSCFIEELLSVIAGRRTKES